MDKYGVTDDRQCYPGTTVLVNKLGLQSNEALAIAERDISNITASQIDFDLPPYDLTYLCRIHQVLFGDLYEWAGSLRTVDISKGDTHFCNVRHLEREAEKIFIRLAKQDFLAPLNRAQLIDQAAEFYGDINMIHPFREGNGRAQRIFFEHVIINAGFQISWEGITPAEWVKANIAAVYCDYQPLQTLFDRCIGDSIALL